MKVCYRFFGDKPKTHDELQRIVAEQVKKINQTYELRMEDLSERAKLAKQERNDAMDDLFGEANSIAKDISYEAQD